MKRIICMLALILVLGNIYTTTKAKAIEDNPFIKKIYPLTTENIKKNNGYGYLKFDLKNYMDDLYQDPISRKINSVLSIKNFIFEIDGEKHTVDVSKKFKFNNNKDLDDIIVDYGEITQNYKLGFKPKLNKPIKFSIEYIERVHKDYGNKDEVCERVLNSGVEYYQDNNLLQHSDYEYYINNCQDYLKVSDRKPATESLKKVYIDTIKIVDTTPPGLKFSKLSIRTNKVTITTEKGANLVGTYENKKIDLKKISETKWQVNIKKPDHYATLKITATDQAGNKKTYEKITAGDPGVIIWADPVFLDKKYAKGTVKNAKKGDIVYFEIDGVPYEGKIINGEYKVKLHNSSSDKKIEISVWDKYDNLLADDKVNMYQYSKVKVGMTKKDLKKTPYRDQLPSEITKVYIDGNLLIETIEYDDVIIGFEKNKVVYVIKY